MSIPPLAFTSPEFLAIFLPVTLIAYHAFRATPYVNIVLFAASIVFYASNGVIYLAPLLVTCVVDYVVGARLAVWPDGRKRKWLFVASVALQIGLLCVFKYAGWLSTELPRWAAALGIGLSISPVSLPLPPGISFYTFHTISYTADIYRRRFRPQGNLIDYVTFVAFFPQLVAGPIARAASLLPQLVRARPAANWEAFETGAWLVCWGLFKKLVIADGCGDLVAHAQSAFAGGQRDGVGYVFMYAFALQIYADFSAYTDIARGIAKFFGIELTRNFLTPYFSASPSEFWQRWHISLSSWLRDYLYIPLGGNREGWAKTLRNLMITMSLGGLWHGAGIGFVVWGLYHGVLLVIYHVTDLDGRLRRALGVRLGGAIAIFLMFQLVSIGWIFFRAPADDLGAMLASLATSPAAAFANPAFWPLLASVLLYGAPLLLTELLGYALDCEFVDVYARFVPPMKVAAFAIALEGILIFASKTPRQFIYFQF